MKSKWTPEDYEVARKYVVKLIDLAEKHSLMPSIVLELAILEGITTLLGLRLGKEVLKDLIEITNEAGGYVDERVGDVLNRFDEIKRDVAKINPAYKETLEESGGSKQ